MGTGVVNKFANDSTLDFKNSPKAKKLEPEPDSFCDDMAELGLGDIKINQIH